MSHYVIQSSPRHQINSICRWLLLLARLLGNADKMQNTLTAYAKAGTYAGHHTTAHLVRVLACMHIYATAVAVVVAAAGPCMRRLHEHD